MINGLTMDNYQLTLTAVVERAERFHRDKEVVSRRPDGSITRTTLGACAERARRLASALAELGIGDGDRVATLLWNQAEHLEAYFAIPAMGAVVHTLNPRLHADELAFIAADAQDKVIIVEESLLDVFEGFRHRHRFEHIVVVTHGTSAPAGMLQYEGLIADAEAMVWPVLDECRAAAMCYTSGTTGRPKGVAYSHRALVLHSMVAALPDTLSVSARDALLPIVPMFHANAWGLPYAAALVGSRLVLPGPRLDPVSLLELISDERVTMAAGVPTVFLAMLSALDSEPKRWNLSALDRLVIGGAAVPQSMAEGFGAHGLTVIQAWGMTETAPLGSVCRLPEELERADEKEQWDFRSRQGIAVPFVDIRARDDDGELIAWDDRALGELEVRGPWVAAEYYNRGAADSFTDDGWFRTGDIVRIDHRGCIRISDRAKDLVKSGGEWISSVDLENHLMAHPAVAEAAVIAVPSSRWGERPLAVVVLHEGQDSTADELRDHLAAKFSSWQIPDSFEFISAIPRNATGKFLKTELRDRFARPATTSDHH
ncbi:long-chain fatty acid--CoA ligase [Nocardia cyriacigeorgica]|uniref:Long-chain fatty acid--CoA ligase n=1 Tax=Nocardia cyriacigeorgica TaxID=135487 RepID=A0ABX0CMK0_9NOCA|nr:long-chain fatty acid--CoA ligase [Nocardia cyriacigeorgica]NEW37646.1 long-chain fatty acid--CoA ligase [Nocardia cyriacigeorgica]NEW48966.1 long-chain fatty acid--CoA ligase [Nocardia cyriacigeorgica]NEW55067.1 long-chain fatty acid--CoA ligase [Nocardia cyriacigeorgica]